MDVKGLIKFLEDRTNMGCYFFPADMYNLLKVIDALKKFEENERYKQIWEELEEMFTPGRPFYICENKNFQEQAQKIMDLKYIIDELKQKYFPEPVKKYITIEVTAGKESEVDDGMEDIKELVDSMRCPKMKISDFGFIKVDKK